MPKVSKPKPVRSRKIHYKIVKVNEGDPVIPGVGVFWHRHAALPGLKAWLENCRHKTAKGWERANGNTYEGRAFRFDGYWVTASDEPAFNKWGEVSP